MSQYTKNPRKWGFYSKKVVERSPSSIWVRVGVGARGFRTSQKRILNDINNAQRAYIPNLNTSEENLFKQRMRDMSECITD